MYLISQRNIVAKLATEQEFLFTKEVLITLATLSVAILNPAADTHRTCRPQLRVTYHIPHPTRWPEGPLQEGR